MKEEKNSAAKKEKEGERCKCSQCDDSLVSKYIARTHLSRICTRTRSIKLTSRMVYAESQNSFEESFFSKSEW